LPVQNNTGGEMTQNNGHYTVQGHSRSFGSSRKPVCDFLLVNNTDLHSISHRFQQIADYWSVFRCRHETLLTTMKVGVNKLETLLYRMLYVSCSLLCWFVFLFTLLLWAMFLN